ncbi:MAG: DNA polymerase III subunit delta [Acutalibacteraceae bacterium]|nr:DNA polymerase III subunit delta [Acutalibacteraceae bacterium]
MADITEKDLALNIKKGKFEKVYLFYGEERYLIRLYAEQISKNAVEDFRDLNVHNFEQNASIDDIMLAAESMPVVSKRSVVSVTDFKFTSLSKNDEQRFLEFLEDLPDFCSVVFRYDRAEFDVSKNKSFINAVKKSGNAVEFARKDENSLTKILCSRAAKQGVNLQPTVAKYIISLCSNDLENLLSEVDKLCNYAENKTITQKDADQIVSVSNEVSIYNLSAQIMAKDFQKAFSTLKNLLDNKVEPVFILITLSRAFTDVYRVKLAESEGVSLNQIGVDFKYGARAFVLEKTRKNSKNIDKKSAENIIKYLYECTMKIKRCEIEPEIVIETAVLELMRMC